MRNFKFYTFSTAMVLLLSGCGGTSSSSKAKEGADAATQTVPVTVLGTTQEWQKDPVQKTWLEANAYCRSLSLEGKNDWRLPSSKEFFALLDTNKSIDELFPKVSTIKEFWSSSETSFDINKAWKITAWSNSESYTDKSKVLGVRCIRGETLSPHNFTQENSTLKDTVSSGKELRWQDDKDASNILVTYDEAKNYCQAKSQRLPNIFELQNMIDKENLISPFQNLNNSDFTPYWSNTPQPTNQTQFLTLNFMTGGVNFSDKNAKNFVRCVKYINHAPTVTTIQSAIVDEDSQTTIILEGIDNDNDTLSVNITKMPDHGTYVGNIYTPQANYHGTDTIKYTVFDGELESEEATVTITVNSINDAPVANNINTSTNEDTSKDIALSIVDIDSNTFTYTVTNPAHGTLTGTAPNLIYTPNANYNGSDTFSYTVNDGSNDSNTAIVTITIGADNDAPTATPLTLSTNEDTNLSITLSGSDPEGSSLTYQVISQPVNGVLTGSGNNRTYTPNLNFNGSDSFSYRVNDGELDSPAVTVNITISSINDIPVANSMNISTNEDTPKSITLSVNDPDDTVFTYTVTNPAHGTLTGTAPNLTYTPDTNYFGTDTFTFYVSDGESNSSQASVDIDITSINDAPIADAGNDIVANEETNITLDGSNSSDVEGAIVSYLWREGATVLATTSSFSKFFTQGIHTLTLQVTDSDNLISTDSITITINADAFTPHIISTDATNSKWLEMVDLDKDGDLDILSVSTGDGGAEVAWYKNHGNNTFTESIITANADTPESIKAADIDNDGDLDILYTTYENSASLIQCINDGSQKFNCSPVSNARNGLAFIEIADIDNDNKPDIVSASWDNNSVDWYKNNGDGTFEKPSNMSIPSLKHAISLHNADFNKDGNIDIVAASNGDNKIVWYENDGSSSFTENSVTDTVQGAYSVDVSDINGDGYDDIVSTSNTDGKVYWHKSTQSTNPTFETPITVTNLSNVYYASAVDMDNDGDFDILSNSSEIDGKIAWYENTGSDTNFPEHIVASGVDNVIRVFAADFDNDGNMDVISGDSTGNIIVYENTATDIITLLPKTGDVNDGNYGANADFTRNNSTNIVTDNVTGLMWIDDSSANTATSYWSDADSTCSDMNKGGYTDWHIPNIYELYYLLDRSQSNAKINNQFLNIATDDGYWINEHTSFSEYSWIDFTVAESNVNMMSFPKKYIRCVRGEEIKFDLVRDDTNLVVKDYKHNLMWDDTTASSTTTDTWIDAKGFCNSLATANYTDWRLPNINELFSITTISGVDISFNSAFINKSNSKYWSSTQDSEGNIQVLDFDGTIDDLSIIDTDNTIHVRCVRNIQ